MMMMKSVIWWRKPEYPEDPPTKYNFIFRIFMSAHCMLELENERKKEIERNTQTDGQTNRQKVGRKRESESASPTIRLVVLTQLRVMQTNLLKSQQLPG